MTEKKSNSYLHGAAILAATAAILKVLGAVFKIALGNIIGDAGLAHFMVAYNVYSLVLTLSTAGLPIALSRLVSEAGALGRQRQAQRIFKVATVTFCVLGALGSGVMLLFPEWLAVSFDEPGAAESLFALAPALFFVCLMSAYRGYTQGYADMKLTSISQIIEVLGKVLVGVTLSWFLMKKGFGLETAAAGSIVGVSVGSAVACAYSFWYYVRMRKRQMKPSASPDRPDDTGKIFKQLIAIAIPIAIGSSALMLINLLDTKLTLYQLQHTAGFSYEEATTLFGVYSGKAETMFNLPSYFITPVAISIIPAISAFLAKKKKAEAAEVAASSMKLTTLIALPAGIGLTVLADPIMRVVFPRSAPEGAGLLAILGIASYLVCLSVVTNAVFQAYGRERLPIITLVAGGAVKIAVNLLLVGNPNVGIFGAAAGTLACYIVITILNIILTVRIMPDAPSFGAVFFRPAICAILMGGVAYGLNQLLSSLTSAVIGSAWLAAAVAMFTAILVAIAAYMAFCILLGAVTRDDLKMLPKGERLADILKLKH